MSSAAQIEANRSNSLHSTGPRTPEGKKTSSSNAIRTGLTSTKLFIRAEEEAYFNYFQAQMHDVFLPVGTFQNHLFDQIVHAAWNIQRCTGLEADLQNEASDAGIPDAMFDDLLNAKLDRIYRYKKMHEASRRRAVTELRQVQIDAEVQQNVVAGTPKDLIKEEEDLGIRMARRQKFGNPSSIAPQHVSKNVILDALFNAPISVLNSRRAQKQDNPSTPSC